MSKTKLRSPLSISPTPFKSSFLALPPSPFQPRTPLTPPPVAHKHTQLPPSKGAVPPASVAPPKPLDWMWNCHQCHRSYHLGVTRRCLDDGHYFCSGMTTAKEWRKRVAIRRHKRHGACASEFDYQGWKAWSRWKERQRNLIKGLNNDSATAKHVGPGSGLEQHNQNLKVEKDCWNTCSYPSECRWGKRFGIHTPVAVEFPKIDFNTMPSSTAPKEQEAVVKLERCKESNTCAGKSDVWKALVVTAKRRTNASCSSSPLSFSAHKADPATDNDGDIAMAIVVPNYTEPSMPASPAASEFSVSSTSTTASAAADMFKDFMRGGIARRRRSSRSSGRGGHGAFVKSFLTVSKQTAMQEEEEEEGGMDLTDQEASLCERVSLGGGRSRHAVGVI